MKRYIFIGSVEYSAHCLKELLKMNVNIVDIMCPYQEVSKFNSDYFDLGDIAKEFNRSTHYFKNIKNEAEYIRSQKPDIIFVLGLSQIIPEEILKIPTMGCIGSHPALLPRNRGRHPIIWAIANGLKKSGITLFWLDNRVDTGDIWVQKEFFIDVLDDASAVYEKVKYLSVELLKDNIPLLENGSIRRLKQDDSRSNYWRKRGYKDGEIDWRMSSHKIYDLVRALTKPYVGAHCIQNGQEVKIWKSRIVKDRECVSNLEPGKVLSRNNVSIMIKTGDGIIEVLEHNFKVLPKEGDHL